MSNENILCSVIIWRIHMFSFFQKYTVSSLFLACLCVTGSNRPSRPGVQKPSIVLTAVLEWLSCPLLAIYTVSAIRIRDVSPGAASWTTSGLFTENDNTCFQFWSYYTLWFPWPWQGDKVKELVGTYKANFAVASNGVTVRWLAEKTSLLSWVQTRQGITMS